MSYIGKLPLVGNYTKLDSLTATTTDTYALTKDSVAVFPHTPANCIVSLNGVIQAPFDSYTISGSNIIFASVLSASDSIDFITVLGDVLNVGTVSDNSITTAKIADDAVTKDKLSAHNYPAFLARLDGIQSVSDNVLAKVTLNEEILDTDSCFDHTTNYRFTPNVAGKYVLYGQIWFDSGVTANNLNQGNIYINKNTSDTLSLSRCDFRNTYGGRYNVLTTTFIADANGSTDYFELYGLINVQTTGSQAFYATSLNTDGYTYFSGYRIGD